MKISPHKVDLINRMIQHTNNERDQLLFNARMDNDRSFVKHVYLQKIIYYVLYRIRKNEIKGRLNMIHKKHFS